MSSFSLECQLSTSFCCKCPKCIVGGAISYEDLVMMEEVASVVSTTSTSFITSYYIQQQQELQQQQNEEESHDDEEALNFSSHVSCDEQQQQQNHSESEEEKIETEQQQQQQQQPEQQQTLPTSAPKKLSRRQKKQLHQKSFLDIAKSLRDSNKTFTDRPVHRVFSISSSRYYHYCSEIAQQHALECWRRDRTAARKLRRRLNRRQLLPDWCYDANENSQRALRELVIVPEGDRDAIQNIVLEDGADALTFNIYDRRATVSHIRLPRSTALAHRNKQRWLRRYKIFNFSDDRIFEKFGGRGHFDMDTRGELQHERDVKFHGKDGRERYNRNGGHHRRSYRSNGYCQRRTQVYMGNSRKNIHGKPWLFNRQKKINRGEDRLAELGY